MCLSPPVTSPVWPESSPEKQRIIARTHLLLGAITLSSELRFVQSWNHWKVYISIFPTIASMTYFGHGNASQMGPEESEAVKKSEPKEIRLEKAVLANKDKEAHAASCCSTQHDVV